MMPAPHLVRNRASRDSPPMSVAGELMRFILGLMVALAACSAGPGQSNAAGGDNAAEGATANIQAAVGAPAALSGTPANRIAQLLARIVPVSRSRNWAAAQAAFPGARWGNRERLPAGERSAERQTGTIVIGRETYEIWIEGAGDIVNAVSFNTPRTDIDRGAIGRALNTNGVQWQKLGCIGSMNHIEYLRLTAGGIAAVLQDGESADGPGGARLNRTYDFDFIDPRGGFDPTLDYLPLDMCQWE